MTPGEQLKLFAFFVLGIALGIPALLAMRRSIVRGMQKPLEELDAGVRRIFDHGMSWRARAEFAEAQLERVSAPETGWQEDTIHSFRSRFFSVRHSPWRRRTRSRAWTWNR